MAPLTESELEKDFEKFVDFCEKQKFTAKELRQICKPLAASWRWRFWKRIVITVFVATVLGWLCSNVEVLNWSLSAVGRLLLIELLPYWNWTPLYNARCLVDKDIPGEIDMAKSTSLGKYETDKMNCVLCENFDLVPSLTNVTYSIIEQSYLEKGLPVIIHDSHPVEPFNKILQTMRDDQNGYLDSDPCDIETNLLLKKFFSIGAALDKIAESATDDSWFLQLRNCQFTAVKASRRFIRRPYYYPLHFEPFYSSWVLMSNNYNGMEREIYVQGLVFVQQLSGKISIHLVPKTPCEKMCLEIEFVLLAGEGLVLSTDLWIFNYKTVDSPNTITTIMEIDWRY